MSQGSSAQKSSLRHGHFVIERRLTASPAQVYAAWATPAAKARWFVGPDNWDKSNHKLDFRVGGQESVSGGPKGGPVHYYKATIADIVPDERIVWTYDMHLDEVRISVSLVTVEFRTEGKGTHMIYTEHGAFLDSFDKPEVREEGTIGLIDQLETYLHRDPA